MSGRLIYCLTFQVYMPTILIVMCSWLIFWLKLDTADQVIYTTWILLKSLKENKSEIRVDPGFPWGGGQHKILPKFPKNCMELRKFLAVGRPRHSLRSATVRTSLTIFFQVSLGVLLMLTMVTISGAIQGPLPQVSYVKVQT